MAGKTALVTGAAKRMGNAIAIGLADQGTNIIVHYNKSEKEAKELADNLVALGVKSWLLKADLSNPASCQELIKRSLELAGGIDILIKNASVFSLDDVASSRLEDIEVAMLTNTWTPFLLSRPFSEKTEHGKIINLLDTRIVGARVPKINPR